MPQNVSLACQNLWWLAKWLKEKIPELRASPDINVFFPQNDHYLVIFTLIFDHIYLYLILFAHIYLYLAIIAPNSYLASLDHITLKYWITVLSLFGFSYPFINHGDCTSVFFYYYCVSILEMQNLFMTPSLLHKNHDTSSLYNISNVNRIR